MKIKILIIFLSFIFAFRISAENKESFLGDINAQNVLIEYASLSCVHCANFHNKDLPSIKKDLIDTGKVKYIYRNFPLDRPAMIAAMVSNCYSGSKYFEVLNTLFRNQKKWVAKSENIEEFQEVLFSVLKIHGITEKNIKVCTSENADNKEKWNTILKIRLEAQQMGVNSTPSFFLNGEKLKGAITSEYLKSIIK